MSIAFKFKDPKISFEDLQVHNARSEPFEIFGLLNPKESGLFKRIPLDVAENTSKKVTLMSTNTAGGRIRFKTDSPYVAVGAIYPPMKFAAPRSTALSSVGAYCFDLYADGKFCTTLFPGTIVQNGSINNFVINDGQYEGSHTFADSKMREITINFPSLVNISDVHIGLKAGCTIEKCSPYFNDKPVVFYGSSITHGACASRPGNTYENMVSRRLNLDYTNLGFSGSARAEDAIIDYISKLEMSAFVFDYDHNAPSPEFLEQTHYPALEKFRAAQPNTPIILMTRPNQNGGIKSTLERLNIIHSNYEKMLASGDKNVYFIDCQEIYTGYDSEVFTIDGVHPTDMGFYFMSVAVEKVLKIIFSK